MSTWKSIFAVLVWAHTCLQPMMGVAQPVRETRQLASFDFDDSGTTDLVYWVDASQLDDEPEDWFVGLAIDPWAATRVVRATGSRLPFLPGESIHRDRQAVVHVFPDPPRPPSEGYGVLLLFYRAMLLDGENWEYSTPIPAFENEAELLIGIRPNLVTGQHHGWLRFSRPMVDLHTPFELVDYAVHPVPGEAIPAGQPPPLPPIQTQVDAEALTFSWDPRWGPLVLETSTNLVPPIVWETVVEGSGDPVTVPTEDEQRFYRLREP